MSRLVKRFKRSTYIYEVWDKGTKIFEGSAREVAEHFYTGETTVVTTYTDHYQYLGKYDLRKRKREK